MEIVKADSKKLAFIWIVETLTIGKYIDADLCYSSVLFRKLLHLFIKTHVYYYCRYT